jgi:hypothetical protein
MSRSRGRTVVAGLTLLALLAAESSFGAVPRRHDAELRAPQHAETIADTASTKRTLSLLQQSLHFAERSQLPAPAHGFAPPRDAVRLALRLAAPLPRARMRYRRITHDSDGEPPA